jgi:NAD(P)H-dependent FMN reductase
MRQEQRHATDCRVGSARVQREGEAVRETPSGSLTCMSGLDLPVISCSLDPQSRSRELAVQAADLLTSAGHDSSVIDLRGYARPPFDNTSVFAAAPFNELHDLIMESDGVILATPIYNWGPSAAAKSLIEATGATGDGVNTAAWFDKVVTFLCAAGLPHSYMATSQLASSLMLDFKCVINPYVGYFSDRDWTDDDVLIPDRRGRLEKTVAVHAELATLLAGRSYSSGWEV